MKAIKYINSTNYVVIKHELSQMEIKGAHFNNGTYALDAKLIIPTVLAGFKHVINIQEKLPLIIAVNSDISMKSLNKTDCESQKIRAEKVAVPLAQTFPDNQVVAIYYDDSTPTSLYQSLHEKGHTRTLHKWGYGTEENAPKIEGAEYFESVYGFPLPNNQKPVCYYDTDIAAQPQNINVIDLRNVLISNEGLLFDVPDELKEYAAIQKQTYSFN